MSTSTADWNPDPNFRIETPRLFLTHYFPDREKDTDFVQLLMTHSGVHLPRPGQGYFLPGASALEEVQFIIRQRNSQALVTGWPGWFHVTLKETGEDLGTCSLVQARSCPKELWWPAPDIGFNFLPAARGKGYATEAAKALIAYAHEHHGVKEVLGFCEEDNLTSCKALERLGMVRWGKGKVKMFKNDGLVVWGPPGRTSLEGYVGEEKIEITG
ncbi:acyl-CoA N-acyltransferase [Cylindrobasidium torrendii FP15055 ss-10]|uniref:Acyl-CoA N-acyltransferase n=1 Tax=Cylindrobasidium torrendii FP15055 ss-10 TaxID=1314674 RepID=A0A0D7B6T2_9AGAR|nr:acyl-CoA N-acyltransferase [Cylindrobasidium torrendii FP15055 ss-10]